MITVTSETIAEGTPETPAPAEQQVASPLLEHPDTGDLEKRIAQLEKQLEAFGNREEAPSSAAPKKQVNRSNNSRGKGKSYKIPADQIRSVLSAAKKSERTHVQDNWDVFLRELKQKNRSEERRVGKE